MRCRKEEVFPGIAKDDPFWEVMNISEDRRELNNGSVGESQQVVLYMQLAISKFDTGWVQHVE